MDPGGKQRRKKRLPFCSMVPVRNGVMSKAKAVWSLAWFGLLYESAQGPWGKVLVPRRMDWESVVGY